MKQYQLGLYEKSMPSHLSLGEKLIETREANFDYLELSIDETDDKLARLTWSDKEIGKLRELQAETGIPVRSICLSGHRRFPLGHPDPEVQRKSLEIMRDAIRLSSRLGVRFIQIAGYDVYYEPSTGQTKENFARNLALSVEMAAREGVMLAFETMETEFMNTVGKTMEWVERLDSPYLQIYPDIGNITNSALSYGTDVVQDLRRGRGHIIAMHLKETLPGKFREIPFGTGHVRFEEAAKIALELGVRMFVGEFWHTGESDWRNNLKASHEFLRRALENSGPGRFGA